MLQALEAGESSGVDAAGLPLQLLADVSGTAASRSTAGGRSGGRLDGVSAGGGDTWHEVTAKPFVDPESGRCGGLRCWNVKGV